MALDHNQNFKFEHIFPLDPVPQTPFDTVDGTKYLSDLYECNLCDRTFKRHATLKKHIRENHCSDSEGDDDETAQPTKCPKCNRQCRSESVLRKHFCQLNRSVKTVKIERRCTPKNRRSNIVAPLSPLDITFECLFCRNNFNDFRTLKQHVRVHLKSSDSQSGPPLRFTPKSKVHKCHICTKRFCHHDYLRLHLYTHTGERPFECPFCAKHFSNPSNLNRHQRIHTGDRPYKCLTCNRRFMNSSNLKAHQMLHTNEKPFKCDICNATFNRLDTIRNHIGRTHAKVCVRCRVCDRAFAWPSGLVKHMKRYHETKATSRPTKRFDAFV